MHLTPNPMLKKKANNITFSIKCPIWFSVRLTACLPASLTIVTDIMQSMAIFQAAITNSHVVCAFSGCLLTIWLNERGHKSLFNITELCSHTQPSYPSSTLSRPKSIHKAHHWAWKSSQQKQTSNCNSKIFRSYSFVLWWKLICSNGW